MPFRKLRKVHAVNIREYVWKHIPLHTEKNITMMTPLYSKATLHQIQ